MDRGTPISTTEYGIDTDDTAFLPAQDVIGFASRPFIVFALDDN